MRQIQLYCGKACKNRAAQRRFRSKLSGGNGESSSISSQPLVPLRGHASPAPDLGRKASPPDPKGKGNGLRTLGTLLGHLDWEDFEHQDSEEYHDPWK